MADFKLSATLVGHESDVRAAAFPAPDVVLTASRDCSVRIWRQESSTPPSFAATLLSRGSEYVNSLAFAPASAEHQQGLVVSGGKDTVIEVKSPSQTASDNAERLLIGHSHNVCTLDVFPNGKRLVSGGWDGQARVWDLEKWETAFTLAGHEGMSVWSVLALDDKTIVTGCADKNIRIFDLSSAAAGEVEPKNTIYTSDVIRALCKVPPNHPSGADIVSASNDGVLRLWKLDGRQIGELTGHDSFVYSLASLPSGELVSSGEDRTVRVWRGDECVQTITHPAISVWTVAANPETGDIVTGASDSIARIFTRRPEMHADAATLAEFDDSVKQSAIPQQQVGGINKEKLPGPNFLSSKSGTKEGQVQMILEENGNVTAHTWSMSQQQWINVGTVVDAAGSTGKKVEYKGQTYDYVFDVDIEDGKPPLKLPYNLSENPYERATKFLGDNELPLSYLDNVAKFITENTRGATLGASASSGPDPMGADARYKPGDESNSRGSKVLPQTEYLDIRAAKLEAVFNKIFSTNQTMIASGRKDAALNPGDESTLKALRAALEGDKSIPPGALGLVVKITTQWPYGDRLAPLDLLRLVARYGSAAQFSDPETGTLLDIAIAASTPSGETPNGNAVMMGARTLANLFNSANGRSVATSQASKAIAFMEHAIGPSGIAKANRNLLVAIATMAVNFAVLVHREKLLTPDQRRRLITTVGSLLTDQTDSEILYRSLIALGTVVSTPGVDLSGLGVRGWVEKASGASSEDRVKLVARECLEKIK